MLVTDELERCLLKALLGERRISWAKAILVAPLQTATTELGGSDQDRRCARSTYPMVVADTPRYFDGLAGMPVRSSWARLEHLSAFVPKFCRPGGSKHCSSSSTGYICATSHAASVVDWGKTGCTPRIKSRGIVYTASHNIAIDCALHGIIHSCRNRRVVTQRLGCMRAVAVTLLAADAASLGKPTTFSKLLTRSERFVGKSNLLTKDTADRPSPDAQLPERNRLSGPRSCNHHLPSAKSHWQTC